MCSGAMNTIVITEGVSNESTSDLYDKVIVQPLSSPLCRDGISQLLTELCLVTVVLVKNGSRASDLATQNIVPYYALDTTLYQLHSGFAS